MVKNVKIISTIPVEKEILAMNLCMIFFGREGEVKGKLLGRASTNFFWTAPHFLTFRFSS